MKPAEIRELDNADIASRLDASHQELFNLRIAFQTGSLEDPGQIRRLQKDVARMLTILRERELAAEVVGSEPVSAPVKTQKSVPSLTPPLLETTEPEAQPEESQNAE